jgi:hypothetical protein
MSADRTVTAAEADAGQARQTTALQALQRATAAMQRAVAKEWSTSDETLQRIVDGLRRMP